MVTRSTGRAPVTFRCQLVPSGGASPVGCSPAKRVGTTPPGAAALSDLPGCAGTPQRLVAAGLGVRGSREYEEQIGEPIQVDGREWIRVRHTQDRTFGPPTDGSREEESRGALAPSGQD